MIIIRRVKEPWGWMGNMSPFPIEAEGRVWRSAEALFQALRFPAGSPVRDAIAEECSPLAVKFIAKRHAAEMVVAPRSDADVAAMRRVIALKVAQHAVALAVDLRILCARSAEGIVEDVGRRRGPSADFWGARCNADGAWVGGNQLGRLWMEARAGMQARSAHPGG